MYAVHLGDCLDILRGIPDASVQTCVTSPPYFGLRDYGHEGQIGLEQTPSAYIARLVDVFREVRRVLCDDGTLWLNLGDSYNSGASGGLGGSTLGGGTANQERSNRSAARRAANPDVKHKDLLGIPWRVAFALQADGWYLRQDIIWHKPNPMPESVRDRCTKAHEYVFLLSKSGRYFYDAEAIAEDGSGRSPGNKRHKYDGLPGHESKAGLLAQANVARNTRNRRSVWRVATQPYSGAHFAVMPTALVEPCVLAGSRRGDLVLDPFTGSGTVGCVAVQNGRRFVGAELNPEYRDLALRRIGEADGSAPEATTLPDGTKVVQHGLFASAQGGD